MRSRLKSTGKSRLSSTSSVSAAVQVKKQQEQVTLSLGLHLKNFYFFSDLGDDSLRSHGSNMKSVFTFLQHSIGVRTYYNLFLLLHLLRDGWYSPILYALYAYVIGSHFGQLDLLFQSVIMAL